ncbi:Na+/H+ antiporter NhaC [Brumicola pallidula]|uniref:Na+:H+ antiporter, NhaC family n=1 Tax=Brumicola pallidula DSM 14239 = ACAM 615 TaxID=1121922 RepID=K6Z0G4_9ALTE|nr:Na+/H+ antiporter NhaC [Glaciecola pallidula]GAC29696.1 Na+:H+ antiporter, NhaC family [Glaciecola pallidula DSM 14239 = ACAM 615]
MSEITAVLPRSPRFFQSFVCFSVIVMTIAGGLFAFGISLHALMFLCLLWTGLHAYSLGYNYLQIRDLMTSALSRAMPAIYIFILIGMVISSFMHSGTIATLMYYGLSLLSPSLFLAAGLLLCALMSVATGTSWGTVGTLGVVFIGIGSAMNIPLPLVAGMIVCGATFGDKMSPISDTTNLAAMSAGTDLYRHIYSMLFTTLPAFILTFVIFLFIGFSYADKSLALDAVTSIQSALASNYSLTPLITLLPLILLATLSIRKVPAEVTMSCSIVLAVLIAVIYQGANPVSVLNALWENKPESTGIPNLDALLGRGGISSMSWTLLLALMAIALGGILHGAGFLTALLAGIIAKVKRTATLVATTILTGFLGNVAMGEAYISIILSCQLFKPKYEQQQLDNAVLSRSVEEGSTMTTGLIPWTTAGAFYTATLGVDVLDYLPYAFFNYLNAIVAVAMAAVGVGLLKSKTKPYVN